MPQATEKLKHNGLDHLYSTSKSLREATQEAPALWKADIDAAYRYVVQAKFAIHVLSSARMFISASVGFPSIPKIDGRQP